MGKSTQYDVKLVYTLQDNVSSGMKGIASTAVEAANTTDRFGTALKGLAGGLVAGVGFSKAKSALFDFNAEMESSQISIATVSRMFGKSSSFGQAMDDAAATMGRYQESARTSTATTQGLVKMHQSLASAFAQTSASQATFENIVKGAAVVAPTLGVDSEMLSLDIKQMLQGSVTNRDRAANALLSSIGLDRETFNKNVQANAKYAVDALERSLGSRALTEAAAAQGRGFAGEFSTLIDSFEILAGQAGKGLFEAVTDEIRSWNQWMVKNKETVDELVKTVGTGLVDGFKTLRDSAAFLVEHKDELIMIAEAYIAMKGIGMLSDGFSAAGKFAKWARVGIAIGSAAPGGMGASLAAMGGSALAFVTAPATLAAITTAVVAYGGYKLYKHATAEENHDTKSAARALQAGDAAREGRNYRGLDENVYGTQAYRDGEAFLRMNNILKGNTKGDLEGSMFRNGLYKDDGTLDREKAMQAAKRLGTSADEAARIFERFVASSYDVPQHAQAMAELVDMANKKLGPSLNEFGDVAKEYLYNMTGGIIRFGKSEAASAAAATKPKEEKQLKPPSVHINIARVQVDSQDPDRFVGALVDLGRRALARPSQALTVPRI